MDFYAPEVLRPVPYGKIENVPSRITMIIGNDQFEGIRSKSGKFDFLFQNEIIDFIEIINKDNIDYDGDIDIMFYQCQIRQIEVNEITSSKIKIAFHESIVSDGKIKNNNIKSVQFRNCMIGGSIYLQYLQKLNILYYDFNFDVFYKLLNLNYQFDYRKIKKRILNNINKYIISSCKNIYIDTKDEEEEKTGRENIPLEIKITYSNYYQSSETMIINTSLTSLIITGNNPGSLSIENTNIGTLVVNKYAGNETTIFNLKPKEGINDSRIEIGKSNLSRFEFNNVLFADYSKIHLYHNKFSETTSFISSVFPKKYDDDKFVTSENHYAKKDSVYYLNRYDTFLQIKSALLRSGNIYEMHRFHGIAYETLRKNPEVSKADRIILFLNRCSNNHGLSITKPLLGFGVSSITLYILYL